jgi:nicotinamide-nucleotide amidase
MIAELITIGDELLIGQVVNNNASWIGEQLNKTGIRVHQISTISDSREHILRALDEAKGRADLIIATGGLGPTKDDLTKTTVCEYFNSRLVFSEETYKDITELFNTRAYQVTESNRQQAEVPEGCRLIKNKNGTAPGMWFERDNRVFIFLPGVPFEMKAMIREYIIPQLREMAGNEFIYHKTILTQGIGESFLSEKISQWENSLPSYIKLAYLPSPGLVRLRLSAYGMKDSGLEDLKITTESLIDDLKKIIGEYIYGYDDDTLEEIIGRLLREKGKTISTAESCTGGYIAHRITSIAGSSEYYTGTVVAYSNRVKENVLKVKAEHIKKYGAVSEQVVTEMAKGIRELFGTDYSIAVTGIAGPDGGTDEKPVGTTWIAIGTPDKITARRFLFGDNRERNITRTCLTALNMLRKEMVF